MDRRSYTTVIASAIGLLLCLFGSKMVNNTGSPTGRELLIFSEWKAKFGKHYSSPNEELFRQGLFFKNLEKIKSKNSAQGQTAVYGLNEFADLALDEIDASIRNRFRHVSIPGSSSVKVDNLLTDLDWRSRGIITPVKNMGQCDSSYAFVVVEALTALNAIDLENVTEYSTQELIDCSSTFGNGGCYGGSIQSAYQYVMENGIQTAASYPYTGVPGPCKADK